MNGRAFRSPFHDGERSLQRSAGMDERLEGAAQRAIRDSLSDDHRRLFSALPLIFVGSSDEQGHVWASVLADPPGFVSAPDPGHLEIRSLPAAGDPLGGNLETGRKIAVLGIDFARRRRSRANGEITFADASQFRFRIEQSFGNCPKYIRARQYMGTTGRNPRNAMRGKPRQLTRVDARCQQIIEGADTFFIATRYAHRSDRPEHGTDVSHRGGRPGFVHIRNGERLIFPDFTGNSYFNTLGNLLVNPCAGLLFIDFEKGDLLLLTGRAGIRENDRELRAFAGAQRIIEFDTASGVLIEGGLGYRSLAADRSANLGETGTWAEADAALASCERSAESETDIRRERARCATVEFAASGIVASWDESAGTLLDLAESEGLSPAFSCRAGVCHTCAVSLISGEVKYVDPALAAISKDLVLICSAVPASRHVGSSEHVILDL